MISLRYTKRRSPPAEYMHIDGRTCREVISPCRAVPHASARRGMRINSSATAEHPMRNFIQYADLMAPQYRERIFHA